jgi:broad specificity phosphatase PhoE
MAILTSHAGDSLIAAFFHGDPIKLALAHFIGLPLDHFQKLAIAPASATILTFHENRFHLIAMNLIPPFDAAVFLPPARQKDSRTRR